MRLSAKSLSFLFLIGSGCGLIGDHAAVVAGATRYVDTGGVPSIWDSPLFFPPMVGLATIGLAELRLRLAPARAEGGWEEGLAAVASVLGMYLLTALLTDEPTSAVTALLICLAALVLARFGGGWAAVACGAIAAVAGPAIEIAEQRAGIFEYTDNVDGLLGVAPWLVPLYFAFGIVCARLGELLSDREGRAARP